MSHVVIVGASVGGVKAAQALRAEGFVGEITMVESEPIVAPYDRPPLSKGFLKPGPSVAEIDLLSEAEMSELRVSLLAGFAAVALDTTAKKVTLASGDAVLYDELIIATGARARRSPWGEGPGMHVLRNRADALSLRAELLRGRRLLIVGAGFIGAEVAATAVAAGMLVTLVDPLPAPMSRVLNEDVGRIFGEKHASHGVRTVFGQTVASVRRLSGAFEVDLSGGGRVEVDAVLVGIGAVVNTEWLESSGIVLDGGVVCDASLRAEGFDDIYAIGDVSRWMHSERSELVRLEHWTSATEQALVIAANIVAHRAARTFTPVEYVWSDQYDWKIQVVGRTGANDFVVTGDPAHDKFAVTYSEDGISITGAVIVNWPRAMVSARRAIASGQQVQDVRDEFERWLSPTPASPGS